MRRELIFGLCLFAAGLDRATAVDVFGAIRGGDIAAVRAWAQTANDLEVRDRDGNTPLIAAALYANTSTLELLIEQGADVNATNSWSGTALLRGSYDYAKARLLVRHGAKVNVRSHLGNTALILAARVHGNSRTVRLLLEAGADVNQTNSLGANALMCAAAADDEATVRLLLDHGADPKYQPAPSEATLVWGGGRTPLMWAAFRGNLRIAKMLAERGAKSDQPSGWGTPLSQAAWNEHTAMAKWLLEQGAPVAQREPSSGFTPLHWAASSETDRTDLVKLLLKAGADPNSEGGAPVEAFMGVPQTPLLIAKKRGDTEIVRELQRAGAKPTKHTRTKPPAASRALEFDLQALRQALTRAVPPLQESAKVSRDSFVRHASKQDCMSCHQQNLPMAALALTRSAGVPVAEDLCREQSRLVVEKDFVWFTREPTFHPDAAQSLGYAAFGAAAEKVTGRNIDEWVHHLALIQGKEGQWHNNLPRPPIQTSDVGATALAVHALRGYPLPGRSAEFNGRIERARKWLWKLQPVNHEERVYQLLGLHWAGEPAAKLQKLAIALIAEQREDGGWAQLPKLEPDAYATGQALFALHQAAGIGVTRPQFRRGAEFLLNTQLDDGTWRVVRRAFPFQPTMRSGFPHGRDGWISSAGSSWATMALALALREAQQGTELSALR